MMQDPERLRSRLLSSFPHSECRGVVRPYVTGQSGLPTMAVEFNPFEAGGLDGTFVVKFGSHEWATAEQTTYKTMDHYSFIAQLRKVSAAIGSSQAVAYDVAFQDMMHTQSLTELVLSGSAETAASQ